MEVLKVWKVIGKKDLVLFKEGGLTYIGRWDGTKILVPSRKIKQLLCDETTYFEAHFLYTCLQERLELEV